MEGEWINAGCGFVCTPYPIFNVSVYFYGDATEEVYDVSTAEQLCKSIGMELVSVNSKEENEFVYQLDPDVTKLRWLGAYRTGPGMEDFVMTDGTPLTQLLQDYVGCVDGTDCLFLPGEPNNFRNNEKCIQMGHETPFSTSASTSTVTLQRRSTM